MQLVKQNLHFEAGPLHGSNFLRQIILTFYIVGACIIQVAFILPKHNSLFILVNYGPFPNELVLKAKDCPFLHLVYH